MMRSWGWQALVWVAHGRILDGVVFDLEGRWGLWRLPVQGAFVEETPA